MRSIVDDLKDIKEDNITIEDVRALAYKFNKYEINGDWIYGKEGHEPLKYSSLFKRKNKVDMILSILKIGKILYEDDTILKTYYEDYKFENKNYKKPRIEINMQTLNEKISDEIYKFFYTYGMFNGDKCNLKVFLRKIIEFYCTVKIMEKVNEKNIESIDDNMLLTLYPQYRYKDKEKLSQGVATNIQENGILKSEKKSCIFTYFEYNTSINNFEMFKVCNDYIVLAYYQLATFVILKKNGDILPRCEICGDYIEDYERSSKSICDKESCRKARQRNNTAKFRKKKKEMEEKK